jgi:hypothetical protein
MLRLRKLILPRIDDALDPVVKFLIGNLSVIDLCDEGLQIGPAVGR